MRDLTEKELNVVSGAGGYGGEGCGCDDGKKNHGNNGFGNGGCDGVPGRSGKEDYDR